MIKIEDLDEFEGTAADMVRAWLRAKGWEPLSTLDTPRDECWRLDNGRRGTVWIRSDTPKQLARTIEILCAWTDHSPQSLLREINPRMLAGWPSEEERARHRYWLAAWESPGCDAELAVGYFDEDEEDGSTVLVAGHDLWTEVDAKRLDMKFWPCDQHGNKTRRGA